MTARLAVVVRGYDRLQVDRLIDRLSRDTTSLKASRDAAVARAEKAAEDLALARAEVESVRRSAQEAAGEHSLTSVGVRITKMLDLAQQEATEICRQARDDAGKQADDITRVAREDARDQANAIRRQAVEEQARVRLNLEVTARECASMRAEAHAQARKIIEDAHEQAHRELEERELASRVEARNRIKEAQAQSDNMLAVAEEQVAGIEAQWVEVHTWLSRFRETMATVPTLPAIPATSLSAPIQSTRRQLLPPIDVGAIRSNQPSPESDDAGLEVAELAREDVLAYRHRRQRH
ncbi:MAG: hypothetical protein H0T54_05595 [Geodermatophilaceae bacterium]|nr:hypothetical protein [Geodermatophilaceae bacterium]